MGDGAMLQDESWVEPMAELKNSSALERLLDLRQEVEERLNENEDYRTLVALNRAIADITGAPSAVEAVIGPAKPGKPKHGEAVEVGNLSQADAAHVLLTKVLHEPVVIAHLVRSLNAHGVSVGGANPNINLSSVLSKDGRFRSVRYKERACWWVKGTPFPGELDTQ